MILLLALMLVVGGANVFSAQIDEKGHFRQGDGHHPDHDHSHHHALPLLEMLPPIGPLGIVAIVVVADLNYSRPDDAIATSGDTNATSSDSGPDSLPDIITIKSRVAPPSPVQLKRDP